MTLTEHIDAITAILHDRDDAEAEATRAWMVSLPASRHPLSDEERASIERARADHAAGRFVPGEEMSLRIGLRGLREVIAPLTASNEAADRTLAFIEEAMKRAAAYIQERRLFVAPPKPAPVREP